MRATPLSAAAVCMLLCLGPAVRAFAQERDPDVKIAGGGALPTGWHARTERDAVVKADSAGQATNELSILVRGGKVTFQVNGKEVYSAPAAGLDTRGIVGYRVNHNLDVHLSALGIHKL